MERGCARSLGWLVGHLGGGLGSGGLCDAQELAHLVRVKVSFKVRVRVRVRVRVNPNPNPNPNLEGLAAHVLEVGGDVLEASELRAQMVSYRTWLG